MKTSNTVSVAIAEKAALIGAKARWGSVTVGQGVPIVGLADDKPRAYVFPIAFGKRHIDADEIAGQVGKRIAAFAAAYSALNKNSPNYDSQTRLAGTSTKLRQKFKRARATLLAEKEYGTIVVGTNRDRFPVIMTYQGLPFTMTGTALILKLHGIRESLDEATRPIFRMGDGMGYPHFFADFSRRSGGERRYSLLDGLRTDYQLPTPRPLRPISKKNVSTQRQLWKWFEQMTPKQIAKISPKSVEQAPDPMIPGVPDLAWYRGCAPTAAGNILAFWDSRGYYRLVDNPSSDAYDLVDELADAMDTDSNGSTKDKYCDDGIRAVCNSSAYGNNYAFTVEGPSGDHPWNTIVADIDHGWPCLLLLHGHYQYGDHAVSVVGYRLVRYTMFGITFWFPCVTVHDTWPTTGLDVEIPFEAAYDNSDDWLVTRVVPGWAAKQNLASTTYSSRNISTTKCSVSSEVQTGARNDERWFYRMLISKQATGSIAEGFRSIYRDPVLTEEFNMIIGGSPTDLENYARHMRFLSYLVRAMTKDQQTTKDLVLPEDMVADVIRILHCVRDQASPPLAASLDKINAEFATFGGLSAIDAAKRIWTQ